MTGCTITSRDLTVQWQSIALSVKIQICCNVELDMEYIVPAFDRYDQNDARKADRDFCIGEAVVLTMASFASVSVKSNAYL